MQVSGATADLTSKGQGQGVSDSSNVKLKEETENSYQMEKIRCPCGSSLKTDSMIKLIPLMQSRMVAQHKATESNMDGHSSSVPMTKQQVTSPQVTNENSPHGNSSSDVSGDSGSNTGLDECTYFGRT